MPNFNYWEWLLVVVGAWFVLSFLFVAGWVAWVAVSERRQRQAQHRSEAPRHVRLTLVPYNWEKDAW